MPDLERTYASLRERLRDYRQQKKRQALVCGAGLWVGLAAPAVLFVATLEALWPLPGYVRLALTLVLGGALALGLGVLVLWRLVDLLLRRSHPDDLAVARQVGAHYPDVGDRLAHALAVFGKRSDNPERYSTELMGEALRQVARALDGERFAAKLDWRPARRRARRAGIMAGLVLLLFALFHQPLGGAADRLVHPRTAYVVGPASTLAVSPGNAEVVRGQDLAVSVRVSGRKVSQATIEYRGEGSSAASRRPMAQLNPEEFAYEFKALRDTLFYRVLAAGLKSPEYRIAVIELPLVRALRVSVRPPAYAGLPTQFLDENVGDVFALKGSTVTLWAAANKPLKKAAIAIKGARAIPMRVTGLTLEGELVVHEETSYHLELVDYAGRENENPIEYRVTVLPDRAPFVRVPIPGMDVDIGEDMVLPLLVEAEDDFGISQLMLTYRVLRGSDAQEIGKGSAPLPLPSGADKVRVDYVWDLSELNLIPEDVVVYSAEARDNDSVSGPKSARSPEYRVRFPSIYEIYQEVAHAQEEAAQQLESAYEQSKELKERLDRLGQQLRRDPDLDWGERKQVEEALEARRRLEEEIRELSKRLGDMVERMERNDLVTLETLKKYQELQRLFEEVATPEMRRAMEELQRALREIDPNQLRQAVEKFSLTQEDFLKSLERTIALLKRLQIEQKLDEAVRRAQELAQRQMEVAEKASEPGAQGAQLAEQERRLAQEAEALSQHVRDLSGAMREFADMPHAEVDRAAAIMDSAGVASQMEALSTMLQQQKMSGAQAGARNAATVLQQVASTLQTAQKALTDSQRQEVLKALQKTSHDLVQLSHRQEQLLDASEQSRSDSPRVPEMAEAQNDMRTALERVAAQLYSLAKRTFYVSPQMGAAVGRAHDNMVRAVAALEQRNLGSATSAQAAAMSALNQAVREVMRSMEDVRSASSALGFDTFLQRLQNMAGAQEGINQQTMELGLGGQYSLEQQAAMARLAAQQEALRKSLEQLQREMGGRSEILGRLDQVAKDMEEVAKDLSSHRIDQRTLDRQRRILSRLLDSQRSVRERDLSPKRQAQAGKNVVRPSPGPLPPDLGAPQRSLAEDLLRAKKEGYTPDYLELIRLYFEALARQEKP
ncbi:MAG: hypothetical protein ONB07_03730 [candidate division KSB1 bacterium]|nr:hypothetical protein [candidate division KSB1 bacterium]MDZ7392344.1 hypothetical protein [candidate division KSB1 bacterium]